MGSVIVTRVVTIICGGGSTLLFEGIRSDDVFKLCAEIGTKPAQLGLTGGGMIAIGIALVLVSMVLAVLLAFVTYWLGHLVSRLLVGSTARQPRAS